MCMFVHVATCPTSHSTDLGLGPLQGEAWLSFGGLGSRALTSTGFPSSQARVPGPTTQKAVATVVFGTVLSVAGAPPQIFLVTARGRSVMQPHSLKACRTYDVPSLQQVWECRRMMFSQSSRRIPKG